MASLKQSFGSTAVRSERRSPRTLFATRLLCAALALAFVHGCSRVTLVSEGAPIRVGPETKARVYVYEDGQWVLSSNQVIVPEGWYCVPPSYVENK